jgi:hypothetical protein
MPKELQSRVVAWYHEYLAHPGEKKLKKQSANGFIAPAYSETYTLFVRRARNVSLVRKCAENMNICKQKKQNDFLGLNSILI